MSASQALVVTWHLLATAAMVGVIWFVQVVHYPLFSAVGSSRFAEYEQLHQRRTAFVVGPAMAVEGVTAVLLAVAPPPGVDRVWALVGLAVLCVIHTSTVLLQIPQHAVLAHGYDRARAARLVRTNWVRTVGWTIRGVIATLIVVQVASP